VNRKPTKPKSETDLYRPVADYLADAGYTVRSEVHNCDIAAVKGDDLVIIELKLALNLILVAQAAQRQKIVDSVYIAIPRPSNKSKWLGRNKAVLSLLRRLEIGVILVSLSAGKPAVEVVSHPVPFERHKRRSAHRAILREVERRSGDFNQGGSTRTKLVTAYRENAVFVAVCLNEQGPLAPRQLRALGTGESTYNILHGNYYSWFERVSRGIYALTSRGHAELNQYPELAQRYLELLAGMKGK